MSKEYPFFNLVPGSEEYETTLNSLWKQFQIKYPDETACWNKIFSIVNTSICHHCSSPNNCPKTNSRYFNCLKCKKKTWVTAGTFFMKIRDPAAWLAAIWFFEHGFLISANRFHQLLKISPSTASTIFKKIAIVINQLFNDKCDFVDSIDFLPAICKRSKETPARKHPIHEFESIDQTSTPSDSNNNEMSRNLHLDSSSSPTEVMDSIELNEDENRILNYLSQNPIQFDTLCIQSEIKPGKLIAILVMLEVKGYLKSLPGDKYIKSLTDYIETTNQNAKLHSTKAKANSLCNSYSKTIALALGFIRSTYHGISRKYLQLYLTFFWIHQDRKRWENNKVLEICQKSANITYEEVITFVSPDKVKIALLL